jgi:hypothetical protein
MLEEHVALLDLCTDSLGPCHPQTLAATKTLGIAFWTAGYTDQAIGLLDQALDRLTTTPGEEHPERVELLCVLGEILLEERRAKQASVMYREAVACCVRIRGLIHPGTVAAKGDLATVLFGLGEEKEAIGLEREALETALTHLGKTHPVTSVLAWNQALRFQSAGDPDSARRVVISQLVWLLAEEPSSLDGDQNSIRTMLAAQLNWDSPLVC